MLSSLCHPFDGLAGAFFVLVIRALKVKPCAQGLPCVFIEADHPTREFVDRLSSMLNKKQHDELVRRFALSIYWREKNTRVFPEWDLFIQAMYQGPMYAENYELFEIWWEGTGSAKYSSLLRLVVSLIKADIEPTRREATYVLGCLPYEVERLFCDRVRDILQLTCAQVQIVGPTNQPSLLVHYTPDQTEPQTI